MYTLERSFRFHAGHQLIHHDGKCARRHGHSYRLTVELRGNQLHSTGPKTGMLLDFDDINKIVDPMIKQYFDHHWLNDTLKTDSPTSEFIAHWIYHHLKPQLPELYRVLLAETESSQVAYIDIGSE